MDIYFIRSLSNIPAKAQGQELYVTDSWHIRKTLLAEHKICLGFDELLSTEQFEEVDCACETIAHSWYVDNDNDIFTYRGISLGSIAEFELTAFHLVEIVKSAALILTLLRRYSPRRILYDRSLLRVRDIVDLVAGNCSTQFVPIDNSKAPHSPVRDASPTATKTLVKSLLLQMGNLRRYVCPTSSSRILLITDNALDELWNHTPAGRDFVTLFDTLPRSRFQAIKLLLYGKIRKWERDGPGRYRQYADTPEELSSFDKRWSQYRETLGQSNRFFFQGLNLYPCIAPALERIVRCDFRRWISVVNAMFRLFESEKISAVVVPADTAALPRLCVEVANLLGVPTLVVQHGLKDYVSDGGDMKTARYAAVWSEWVKQHRTKGRITSDRVFVVGSPYFENKTVSKGPNIALGRQLFGRRDTVVILPQSFYRLSAVSHLVYDGKFLDLVLSTLHECSVTAKIIVKPHPGIRPGYYEGLVCQHTGNLDIEVRYGDLKKFLEAATTVIGGNSTGLVEAVALHKQAVCVNVTSRDFAAPLDGRSGIPVAKTALELKSIVDNMSPSEQVLGQSCGMSEYAFGLMDGDHMKRLSNLIHDLALCPSAVAG